MALTKDNHVIDPHTGFAVDPNSGHPVGLVAKPHGRIDLSDEYPKWVEPHASHIVRKEMPGAPDHVSVKRFADWHINRETGALTVLVKNDAEEKLALAEYVADEDAADAQRDPDPQPSEDIGIG